MRQKITRQDSRRGDTLIEVMLSISIFAMVSLLTINMMNDGINTAQRTLEAEMARNEIDGQAEALRYIHNNYVSERNMDNSQFRAAWKKIVDEFTMPPSGLDDISDPETGTTVSFDINGMNSCEDAYGTGRHLNKYKAFVVNPRLLVPNSFDTINDKSSYYNKEIKYMGFSYDDIKDKMLISYNNKEGGVSDGSLFSAPSLYPRIIYKTLGNSESGENIEDRALSENGKIYNEAAAIEGLWINVSGNNQNNVKNSDYYDFYIRTCWQSAGTHVPSTITTVVRLYNPEVME